MSKNQRDDQRLTKAERKEQARIEREQIQRKQASRKRNRTVGIVVGLVVVAVAVAGLIYLGGNDNTAAQSSTTPPTSAIPDPATLPGILQTPPAWPNNLEKAGQRLAILGLPGLSDTVLHEHARLFIYVDGQSVEVPADIGISSQVASPLHTHETSGTIHIESADPNFQPLLGQFMDVWGVYFTPTCIGSLCNDGDQQLRVFLNGEPYTGDPTLMLLSDQDRVVITYGTADQVPDPLPNDAPID